MVNNWWGYFFLFFCGFTILVLTGGTSNKTQQDVNGTPLSPTDFVVDEHNDQVIIAQKTGHRIDFLSLSSGEITNSISSELPPTGICIDNKGKVYVSCSYSEGEVLIIDIESRSVLKKLDAGHGAISPVYSSSSNRLYVANQYDNDVSVIDPESGQEITRIAVLRQPMTMDITEDGKWLFVGNLLPATRADIDTVAADVSIIDLDQEKAVKHLKLSNGSNAIRGIRISPDEKHAFVSHNLGRFQVPTSQLEQGWMNTSALSILDVVDQQIMATILLDEPENGAAASWGVDVNNDIIVVNHSGTHDYSIIEYHAMIDKLKTIKDTEVLSYDLTFLTDIRKRYHVNGEGPRAVKISGEKIFTALYFSDAIQVDDIKTRSNISTILLNPNLKIDIERKGEMIFNDARHCFQKWQACTGCHPNDARTDGLNWDLLNDGIGNPKNCKSMIYAHDTPPAMISGVRETAEIAVRAGFRHIQFAHIEEEQACAVDMYLKSLKPVPSPYLVDGQLSEKAKIGKQVFIMQGCNNCHSGPYFTDKKMYKIGTPGSFDRSDSWDTPTLAEVWRTAPFLHDGRCATMKDVFQQEKHGLTEDLSGEELEFLVEYILSL